MTENLLNDHDVVKVLNSRQFYAELHYLKIMLAFIVDYVGEGEKQDAHEFYSFLESLEQHAE